MIITARDYRTPRPRKANQRQLVTKEEVRVREVAVAEDRGVAAERGRRQVGRIGLSKANITYLFFFYRKS